MSCVFCELPETRIIEKSSLSKVFRDAFPVTPLHTLIIPIRHVSDYFDLSQEEKADIEIVNLKDQIKAKILNSINEKVDAKIAFADADLSLFRNFPNASVSIEKLSIINKAPFIRCFFCV